MSSKTISNVSQATVDFEPSCWGDYFLHVTPLDEATKQEMEQEVGKLKEEVKNELLARVNEPTKQLELVDAIERLGVAYHFDTNIEEILDQFYMTYLKECDKYNLHHVSLGFRIFRQHGFNVSCDVFKRFMSKKGLQDDISNDLEGILSMYEACHVEIHEDDILEEALMHTTSILKSMAHKFGSPMAQQVEHALHQPVHKGIIRVESKQYISFYQLNPSHNVTLLQLAKLDFNLLQSLHQMELRDLVLWWKGLHAKLPYARDRSIECFFWTLGCYYEPQYSVARKIFTRLFMVVQTLDDINDSYGNIQDRQLLIQAVHGWDYSYVNQLPKFYNDCYKALLETFDEVEQILANQGRSFCSHYWKVQMKINCQAWFDEAKWCATKYIPTYDEYIEVALISIAQTAGIVAAYLGLGEIATQESFEWVSQIPMPKIIRSSDIILRLMNDIGGHKYEQDREHVASAVECYMKQHGISNEVQVYEELEEKVKDAWKDVNEGMLKPYAIPKPLLDIILNQTRVPDVMYKGRTEGYTLVNKTIQQKIASVLIDPVPM
ncbi:putative sesquiterpene synthase [Silene latifolia]|uniref:putative sesquiterpene synthase n=1 Tax=Silene latifolia TaxID=37657 RepID=UPI003D78A4AA